MQTIWGGTAKKLKGNCLVIGAFISEGDNVWSVKEKKSTWAEVEKAMNWLTKQAEEYEVDLSFELLPVNLEEESEDEAGDAIIDRLPRLADNAKKKNKAVNDACIELGYESVTDFYQSIIEGYADYSVHFLMLLNADDRSYMTTCPIDDEVKFLELNMVFKNNGKINSFVVAHETLHAYSAMDLYNVAGDEAGKEAEEASKERCENEVMCAYQNDVENSAVSDYTAFLIGWHDEPEDWYEEITQPFNRTKLKFIMNTYHHFDDDGNLSVETEEELLKYSYEAGELTRIRLNEDDNLIQWRHYDNESEEEEEYWETGTDANYYYLDGKFIHTGITVPKKSGQAYILYDVNQKYEPWVQMTQVES
ncbi:MAG TPA: hypothetical protein PK453_03845 [Leptospiraceae bacterium]|nr:hypothetical protein [Leptospiraceae bacterium]HNF12776.1 hypothetical protein [Leptospiraceae bacterium]HNH07019.1 hypothetical protein [Leptospiraceae bacterium]HNM03703.1 hypothetical protein [Leptospiraceae bacterium]HNN02643.1 hypothetical protein [Leptospiraceae bacterium]